LPKSDEKVIRKMQKPPREDSNRTIHAAAAALMNECPFIYEEEKMMLLCVSGTIFAKKGNINVTN